MPLHHRDGPEHDTPLPRTPQQTLRLAADKLRALAGHATPGPWYPDGTDGVYCYGPSSIANCPPVFRSPDIEYADVRWISTVHPGLAEPLAVLLLAEAECVHAREFALAVARCVLGEESDTDE